MKAWISTFLLALAALLTPPVLAASSDTNYQDWWWNPDMDGMALNIGHQNDTLFISWVYYDDKGDSTWLTMSGKLENNFDGTKNPGVTGDLYRSTGPAPGPNYNASTVQRQQVGTASIRFSDIAQATLEYDFDGKTGKIELRRYHFSTPSLEGKWRFTAIKTACQRDECDGETSYYSGIMTFRQDETGTFNNGRFIEYKVDGDSPFDNLILYPEGSVLVGSVKTSCMIATPPGYCYDATIRKVRIIDDALLIEGRGESSKFGEFRIVGIRENE